MSRDETTVRTMRPDTLAVSVAILLAANVVQRGVGFGRGIFFCRWLSPDELGVWELAYSFLLLASPVIVLGLPGSFGRYLERYRQQGQLRTFLGRSIVWTASLTIAACATIIVAAPQFSGLIFGKPNHSTLVVVLALCLAAVILHHFLEALFAALRKYSIVSSMHFCQSTMFAVVSLSLLWWWRFAPESIVIGYGAACLLSSIAVLVWKGRAVLEEAVPDGGVAHSVFWPPLVRFAAWVWIINVLCHLFGVVDRYMLVHWTGLSNEAALALVGNYHASRVIPILFLSIADLLAGAVLPYLSHDWEAGARHRVSERLNQVLKLTSVALLAAGVAVLWCAPVLFRVAFEGRYDLGLAVLPWTLTYCVWYALLLIAQNYVWCAEKAWLGALPLAVGLVVNIALNTMLIPAWGLSGAVISTTVATGAAVAYLFWVSWRAGMRIDPGMLLLSIAPASLCGGIWVATPVLFLICLALPFSHTLVGHREREALTALKRSIVTRLSGWWAPTVEEVEAGHAV